MRCRHLDLLKDWSFSLASCLGCGPVGLAGKILWRSSILRDMWCRLLIVWRRSWSWAGTIWVSWVDIVVRSPRAEVIAFVALVRVHLMVPASIPPRLHERRDLGKVYVPMTGAALVVGVGIATAGIASSTTTVAATTTSTATRVSTAFTAVASLSMLTLIVRRVWS